MLAETMLRDVAVNVCWSAVFAIVGGIVGVLMVLAASVFLPRIIDRMTPNIDEEREIARGNLAVGQYFGRVTAAAILGISIVVGAAVLGGILVAAALLGGIFSNQ